MPSPTPKRSDQRTRNNSPAARKAVAAGKPKRIPSADKNWPPRVKEFYRACLASGQTEFWEPSDYALLRVACDVLADAAGTASATMYAQFIRLTSDLLLTETARRKAYVELVAEIEADTRESASDRVRQMLSVVPDAASAAG